MSLFWQAAWVATGGALGAVGRWAIGRFLVLQGWEAYWATAVINVTGSFLMGWGMVSAPESLRPFLLVGILGGYTTFSTFSAEQMQLIGQGKLGSWALYAGLSLALGLAGFVLGNHLGTRSG